MIKLKEAPIFYEFFKRTIEYQDIFEFKFDIGEEFEIIGFLGQVSLKRVKPWNNEIIGSYVLNAPNITILTFRENGVLELDVIGENLPYASEMKRLYIGKKVKKMSTAKTKKLDEYFKIPHINVTIINVVEEDLK